MLIINANAKYIRAPHSSVRIYIAIVITEMLKYRALQPKYRYTHPKIALASPLPKLIDCIDIRNILFAVGLDKI
jgi:hypothetical protein